MLIQRLNTVSKLDEMPNEHNRFESDPVQPWEEAYHNRTNISFEEYLEGVLSVESQN